MKGYLISLWDLLDPLYYFCTRLTCPPSEEAEGNIFRVRLTKYKGRNIVLADGTRINKNDTLVKIHLYNVKLLQELKNIKSEIKKAKMIYRSVQKSLPGIERYIQNQSHADKIKGIVGITSLHKGCERLGFETFDISHPIYKWFKRFAFLTIAVLSSQNSSIWHLLTAQQPKYLFMSTEQLSNMYRQ